MGSFDISRINFDAKKHYASVRMQQGRVLTDDDWNESERIENEDRRRSNVDIIGAYGCPDDGFKIEAITGVAEITGLINTTKKWVDFLIKAGTLYLGGLRFELDENETFRSQKDWFKQPSDLDLTPSFTGSATEKFDLVYFEGWQQAVSAVEDESLFEVALGGPDTTTRIRNMRRVRIEPDIKFPDCADAWGEFITRWKANFYGSIEEFELIRNKKLKVTYTDIIKPEDLCTPSGSGGYLGAENQAIRVQIVEKNKFTWGFDNASPYYQVAITEGGKKVQMLTEPKDQYHWPLSGQVVELLLWSAELPNKEKVAEQMGFLTSVEKSYNPVKEIIDSQESFGSFTLKDNFVPPADRACEYYYLRVWNRGDDLSSDPLIPISPAPVALGHTGLEVTITGDNRNAGDYWVIAARPETPNKVVPRELETGISPHGVRRFFAPLAVIRWSKNGENVTGEIIHDCRKKFRPLTEQECCCTYTVGDGIRSHGDYDSIENAINNLPGFGGKICVLPGEHIANVSIVNRKQIRITGCREQSIIRPFPDQLSKPIFLIQNSQKIQIDQLNFDARDGIAIEVSDLNTQMPSEKIKINENFIIAGEHAIKIITAERAGDNSIDILYNQIGMIDNSNGKAAIFTIADDVLIERNRIVVVPAPDSTDQDDPRPSNNPADKAPYDPCLNPGNRYKKGYALKHEIFAFQKYVSLYRPSGRYKKLYGPIGGIQVGHTSERVRIKENEIIGGKGNGITLGHLDVTEENSLASDPSNVNGQKNTKSILYEICIEENQILQMGLSGISTVINFDGPQHIVQIEDFTIYRNAIKYCSDQVQDQISPGEIIKYVFGGIILCYCENGKILDNRVETNGTKAGLPVCGVFILFAEKMDISNNYILKTGIAKITNDTPIMAGTRGGIVILMSFKSADIRNLTTETVPSFDGVPVAKIHDNIIDQPLGHALFIIAFGPVSVVSNQFTSLGTDIKNPFSFLASTVYIFNLGVSKDFFREGLKNIANKKKGADLLLLSNPKPKVQKLLRSLQFLPNGKVMFADNQTTLDMRSPSSNFGISSQLIFSFDDIAFNNNQSECAGFVSLVNKNFTLDTLLINTILCGVSLRSNDNRFQDGLSLTFMSLLSYGYMNTATGNQATNCIFVFANPNFRKVNDNMVLIDDPCAKRKKTTIKLLAVPKGNEID